MAKSPSAFNVVTQAPIVERDGRAAYGLIKLLQDWDTRITSAISQIGKFIGVIGAQATVEGRTGSLTVALQYINSVGVVQPEGISAATDFAQGGVVLPSGAGSNSLGSAALEASSSFDPAGAAATAQSNAEAFASSAAATAQANAEAFAANASNLTSGTVDTARLPGLTATITTAQLTSGGAQGSMTFTNGILTAQAPAT